ncbi:MAG: Dyp-type peroxidase domain-containing protein, partial [Mycobacterium sp.]
MTGPTPAEPTGPSRGFSRRKLIGAAGVGAAIVGTAGASYSAGRATAADVPHGQLLQGPVPFRGERQAGIITEAQDRMQFATFDVTTESKSDLVELLQLWTKMAERMTAGEEA